MRKLSYIILGVIAEATIEADYITEWVLESRVFAGLPETLGSKEDYAIQKQELIRQNLIEYMPNSTERYRLKFPHS